jgi:hypothetical protein
VVIEVAGVVVSDMESLRVKTISAPEISGELCGLYREEYSAAYDNSEAAVRMSRS